MTDASIKKTVVDSKKLLKDLANKKTKVKFSERVKLEIIAETEFYKKGQKIAPHVTFGNHLISLGIAKKVK